MDTILTSTLNSNEPDSVKKVILNNVIKADGSGRLEKEQCCCFLERSLQWSLNEDSSVHRLFGRTVLKHAGQVYTDTLLTATVNLLAEISPPSAPLYDTLACILNSLRTGRATLTEAIQRAVHKWLSFGDHQTFSLGVFSRFCKFLTEKPLCIPSGNLMPSSIFSRQLLSCLARIPFQKPLSGSTMVSVLGRDFTNVSGLLNHIWSRNKDIVPVNLQVILRTMSGPGYGGGLLPLSENKEQKVSCCLAMALCTLHEPQISSACKMAIFGSGLDDKALSNCLSTLIDWLIALPLRGMSTWVVQFMEGMLSKKSYVSVLSTVLPRIEPVFAMIRQPWSRAEVLPVVRHILLGVQHAPVCYSKVLPKAMAVLGQLEEEGSPDSLSCLGSLAMVFQCLMSIFAAVPVEEAFLTCINRHSSITQEDMAYELQARSWRSFASGKRTAQEQNGSKSKASFPPAGSAGSGSADAKKLIVLCDTAPSASKTTQAPGISSSAQLALLLSTCGKAGLVNLGNTCYMNSVIQALFMNRGFRYSVLKSPLSDDRTSVVTALQRAMAFLLLTKRQAYAPRQLLSVARPIHFQLGTQQDCAEFCRHLLDLLHTQLSKPTVASTTGQGHATVSPQLGQASSKLVSCVEKHYQLKLHITYTCEVCHHQSVQVESNFDLMLAFPSLHLPAGETKTQPTGEELASKSSAAVEDTSGVRESARSVHPVGDVSTTTVESPSCKVADEARVQPQCGAAGHSAEPSCSPPTCQTHTSGHVRRASSGQADAAVASPPAVTQGIRGGERLSAARQADVQSEPRLSMSAPSSPTLAKKWPSLPIPSSQLSTVDKVQDLPSLLQNFLSAERLTGDNAYACEKCQQQQPALREVCVSQAPPQLFITLMRFRYDPKTKQKSKIMTKVNYPRFLQVPRQPRLSNHQRQDAEEAPAGSTMPDHATGMPSRKLPEQDEPMSEEEGDLNENCVGAKTVDMLTYELCAVIVHAGRSTDHGHYFTFACEPDLVLDSCTDSSSVKSRVSETSSVDGSPMKVDELMESCDASEAGRQDTCIPVVMATVSRPWYRFNDSSVQLSSLQEALDVGQSGTDTAYMLMYNRCHLRHPDDACDGNDVRSDSCGNEASTLPGPARATRTEVSCPDPVAQTFLFHAAVPPSLAAEVESDNLLLAKEQSQQSQPVFGPQPKPPPPPPPPPPAGPSCGDSFSAPANRFVF